MCYKIRLNNYGGGLVMDTKDKNIWKVATKYVEDLHGGDKIILTENGFPTA